MDWVQNQFCHFSVIERYGILGIKYKLKELQMNVSGEVALITALTEFGVLL